MSGRLLAHKGYVLQDFAAIRKFYNLQRPPRDTVEAAAAYLFLEPCPAEAWLFLPPDLLWDDTLPFPVSEPRFLRRDSHTTRSSLKLDASLLTKLEAAYPPPSGRPGGKILADWRLVFAYLRGAAPTRRRELAMSTLAMLAATDADWGSIAAISLVLLPYFSTLGGVYAAEAMLAILPDVLPPLVEYAKLCKALHQGLRLTYTFPRPDGCYARLSQEEVRQLTGLDVLPGRNEVFAVSHVGGMFMRASYGSLPTTLLRSADGTPHYDRPSFDQEMRECIAEALQSILPNKLQPNTFSQWYARREFWAASGGAPGAKMSWLRQDSESPDAKIEVERVRLNKRAALLLVPEKYHRRHFADPSSAVLYSKAAPKFENGKRRIIWNTSLTHYVAQGFLLDLVEPRFRQGTWYSAANSAPHRTARSIARFNELHGAIGFMWDYADFNINHSRDAQIMLFSVLADLISERLPRDDPATAECRADVVRITSWVNTAKKNFFMHDSETGYVQEAVRSLASGERATSFVNTVLSRAYRLQHDRASRRFFGRQLLLPRSDHQGDDVFATVASMPDATLAGCMFLLTGYAGQLFKITCNHTPSGEFLRQFYGMHGIAGYPIRSAMGLFSGEYFEDLPPDPPSRVSATFMQFSKVAARGGAFEPHLITLLSQRNASLAYSDKNGSVHHVTCPPALSITPRSLGGLGGVTTRRYQLKGNVIRDAAATDWTWVPRSQLASPTGQTKRRALAIPSGEGKTTLARMYPSFFVDHDALLSVWDIPPSPRRAARTAYCKRQSLLCPVDKVLLTWGPTTVDSSFEFLGSIMLQTPTGTRANAENRRYLASVSQGKRVTVRSQTQLPHAALALASQRVSTVAFESDIPPPVVQMPELPVAPMVAKAGLVDTQTLATLQAHRLQEVATQAVASSSFGGAFPRASLSASFARYARDLDAFVKAVKPRARTLEPAASSPQLAYQRARPIWDAILQPNSDPSVPYDHPLPLPATVYGDYIRIMLDAGFSLGEVFLAAVDDQSPVCYHGLAGRIFALMQRRRLDVKAYRATAWLFSAITPATPPEQSDLLARYILGRVDLPPVASDRPGTDLNSTVRLISLRHLDNWGRELMPLLF
ncbi:RNA dependent RNA polymerase [Diplodia scrobiculata RNA virus 1]|uniref:RNA dependent RNA polymerase n=1 Tax=Diplodia scrobiculata RNA virus 1 TaxID=459770 RepID=UPI0001C07CBE|nr:RNA dependent RNA polymerase [Diplodia scrobiculata RNA virus 1]ACD91658.1 RNA dependent RNA polymerase [Diplodia scrobiculata RNA virus 1]